MMSNGHIGSKRHIGIASDQVDVVIYGILAFCCVVVLIGVAWIALQSARECCGGPSKEDEERARMEEGRERLIPEGCECFCSFFFILRP